MKSGSQSDTDSGAGERQTPCAEPGGTLPVPPAPSITSSMREGLSIYPGGAASPYTPTSPLSLSQTSSMRSFMKVPTGQQSAAASCRLPLPPPSQPSSPLSARGSVKRRDSFVSSPCRPADTGRPAGEGLDFLTYLPYEIAMVIVIHADFPAITTIAKVSRSWNRFSRDNAVWRRLFLQQREWRTQRAMATAASHSTRPRRPPGSALSISPALSAFDAATSGASTPRVGDGELHDGAHLATVAAAAAASRGDGAAASLTSRILSAYAGSSLRPAISLQHMVAPSPTPGAMPGPGSSSSHQQHQQLLQRMPRAPPDWRYLFQQRLELDRHWRSGTADVHILTGHADSVYCVQYDHDKIVTGSRDRTIKIWDSGTLECLRTMTGHEASVLCLKYDDTVLVTGSSDATVIVWDWETGAPRLRLASHSAGVLDVAFNDEHIVSCSKDCTIKVWHRATGRLLRTMAGHRGPVNAVQLHGNQIVSASGDSLIKMWDLRTGELLRTFSGHTRGLACVQFDGKTIVSGSSDQLIKVWDAKTGRCKQTLRGHKDLVRTLHFAGGTRAVSGSYDQTIKVWDITTGECTLDLKDMHTSWVFDVQFSASRIVSTSQDQKIILWDFAGGLDVGDIN
ncbi:hypothetical protein H4R18_002563 [Coemansia javaensis]|uniref:F-box domain-containing protein n=1 Tax=Coemansia javaensis TaxID=2761396 RepID=A0A9W8HAH1_9FUNG|nr:hypothetical protein H4R18_002563 [Coemansia javaensis]